MTTHPSGIGSPIPIHPTTAERITTLEAEVTTLRLQVRALLHSAQASATNVMALTDTVSTLNTNFKRALIARQAQLVLDLMDNTQPTFEELWELDAQTIGEDLMHRVERP